MSSMTVAFLVLGLVAGMLTTIAGQGGGLLLLLACSALGSPHDALAITSPALLLGNLHRVTLLHTHVDRPIAKRMIVGAIPGALLGGLLAGVTPGWLLRVLLVGLTVLAIAKALGLLRFRFAPTALVPAGLFVGAMTGTSGGAGVLFAPVLLSVGLTGRSFVATASAVALATHIGRVTGYAALGLFSGSLIVPTAVVTIAIFVGNALGDRVRNVEGWSGPLMTERRTTMVEYGTLVVCVVLSVVGLG